MDPSNFKPTINFSVVTDDYF
jgi:hypothetical protein